MAKWLVVLGAVGGAALSLLSLLLLLVLNLSASGPVAGMLIAVFLITSLIESVSVVILSIWICQYYFSE